MVQTMPHNAELGTPSRSAYTRGCRCPECRAANAARSRNVRAQQKAERPSTTPDRSPMGSWPLLPDGAAEPELTGRECPECDTELIWAAGRAGIRCPACGHSERSPEIDKRLADTAAGADAGRSAALARPEPTQAELDQHGKTLARLRGKALGAFRDYRDKAAKKMTPELAELITWYESEIRAADDPERIWDLVAQWKDERKPLRHWYNTTPDETMITGIVFKTDPDAGENDCQVYLPGESECGDDHEYLYTIQDGNNTYQVCQEHAYAIWPDQAKEIDAVAEDDGEDYQPQPQQTRIGAVARVLEHQLAINAAYGAGNPRISHAGNGLSVPNRLILFPGTSGYVQPENRPAALVTSDEPLARFLARHTDNLSFNPSANVTYCPVISEPGMPCHNKAEYQMTAPDIMSGVIWICENHALMFIHTIEVARKILRVNWSQKIRERYYIGNTAPGMCQLANRTYPDGRVKPQSDITPCQRTAPDQNLGGVRICDHHARALRHEFNVSTLTPTSLDAYR